MTIKTEEILRKEISEKVTEFYRNFHENKKFIPGETKINYAGRVFDENEMISLVNSSLDFWLTAGPYADQLESMLKEHFDSTNFYLVNSGSSANLVMISSLRSKQLNNCLNSGDEVITPAVTFPTTLTPIIQNNLVPVFVDCELDTYNIDPNQIEAAISPKTRAIFLPHTLGNPCNMKIIMDISKKHNLFVIEDSCDALGATFNNKKIGTFGDMASLSFYPAHHMTMGEGGGVVINNPVFENIALSIRDWGRDCWCKPGSNNTCGKRFSGQWGKLPHGYDHKYVYSNIGYNLKLTDMQAAIGIEQYKKLNIFVEKRRSNFMFYYNTLKKYEDRILLPRWEKEANPSWFGFPITVKEGTNVKKLIDFLEKHKIETRKVFAGNIILQPGFVDINYRIHGKLEKTNQIMEHTFFIGVFPGLTDEMRNYVVSKFDEYFSK